MVQRYKIPFQQSAAKARVPTGKKFGEARFALGLGPLTLERINPPKGYLPNWAGGGPTHMLHHT